MRRGQLGDAGEDRAARYLHELGWKIVARQYRVRVGEIDLVALDGHEIVFVEVKTRRVESVDVRPEDAVDSAKLQKMYRAAQLFLYERSWEERPYRFDVIAVVGEDSPTIRHHKGV